MLMIWCCPTLSWLIKFTSDSWVSLSRNSYGFVIIPYSSSFKFLLKNSIVAISNSSIWFGSDMPRRSLLFFFVLSFLFYSFPFVISFKQGWLFSQCLLERPVNVLWKDTVFWLIVVMILGFVSLIWICFLNCRFDIQLLFDDSAWMFSFLN